MVKQTSVSSPMTKDLLMKYTFIALCVIAAISVVAFGLDALIMSIIGVVVAVACDFLLSLVMKDRGPLNVYSAAVAGLIVALSFSGGVPVVYEAGWLEYLGIEGAQPDVPTIMNPNVMYMAVAGISALAVIVFKKLQGLLGRKYVNPAAAAKLLVLALISVTALIPQDHINLANMSAEALTKPLPPSTVYPEGLAEGVGLEGTLELCYGAPTTPLYDASVPRIYNILKSLALLKNHGWLGGASSVAVIIVGIALIIIARRYVKWRIPLTFLLTTAIIAAGYGWYYGEDITLRVAYHLFIGSTIFLAFFMATDPATTPLTKTGQVIFAIGLGILSFVFQIYLVFLGGSILALVIMNLTSPLLDRIGVPKPSETRITRKLPKAKKFATARVTNCIRCGKCLVSCCMNLPVILIKEAVDKGNWVKARKLGVEYCDACGHCSYVCPARIDLKTTMVSARDEIQKL